MLLKCVISWISPFQRHWSGVLPSKSADFQGWIRWVSTNNGYHKLPGFGGSYMPLWHLHLHPYEVIRACDSACSFERVSVLGKGRSEECRDLCLKGWFPFATSSFLVLFCTFTYCSKLDDWWCYDVRMCGRRMICDICSCMSVVPKCDD